MRTIFALILTWSFLNPTAWAQSGAAWIDAIPEPQRAIEKISGKDELDTKSRQGAAIHEIARVILRLGDSEFSGPSRMTAREQALHKQYTDFYKEFSMEYANRLNQGLSPERLAELGNQRPSAPFANLEFAYRVSGSFQFQTFTTVMGEDWVNQWYIPLTQREQQVAASVRAKSDAFMDATRAKRDEQIQEARMRAAVRLVGAVVFLIGMVWLLLSWRGVRTETQDPMRLTGRRAGWVFEPVTGFASDIRVYTSHQTTRSVKRYNDHRPDEVSTHTTSTHHCEFILNNESGKRPIHLADGGLQVGDGHLVSCVWPRNGGKSRGMVLAYNHDTTQRTVFSKTIGWLVGPRFVPGLVATLGVGLAIHWSMAFTFFLLFAVMFWCMGVIRVRAFNRRDVPRVIERLNQDAAGVSPIVGVR